MISVVENVAYLLKIQSEMEELYKLEENWCIISPNLIINSYNHYLKLNDTISLYIVLSKNDDKIECYLPLYIDEKKTLRFVFDTHVDYCGIIGKINPTFLKDFCNLIQNDKRIKRIDFENLLFTDLLLNGLKYYLNLGVSISCYNSHSYLFSDKDIGYFKSLKAKDRSELKRVAKKNVTTIFKTYSYPTLFPIDRIKVLRDKMISNGYRNKDFLDENFLKIINSLYDSKELILITNSIADEMVSIVFTFKNTLQNSYIFWITLYDRKVQYINLTSYLNFISENEFKDNYYYSFARGDYAFKNTFNPVTQNLYNLRYSKSKWDFYFTNYYAIKEFVKRIVKSQK